MAIFAISLDGASTPNGAIEQFLAAHKYTFPVLRGYGYGDEAGVSGTPTTWFVDSKGGLAFQKVGYSEHLVQEFAWRLEAMAKSAAPDRSADAGLPQRRSDRK